MHPVIARSLAAEHVKDLLGQAERDRLAAQTSARTAAGPRPAVPPRARPPAGAVHAGSLTEPAGRDGAERGPVWPALSPLLFDVALPTGLYYLLSALGAADTPALILAGLIPFGRSLRTLARAGRADYLAVMMAPLFTLSLGLVAVTGSPRFVLVKESFGTALLGLWCLASAVTRRPMTFYTARPILTRGRPDGLAAWERLAETSPVFRAVQRRLAVFWGLGLLVEAMVRVAIVLHYPVHTAAGLVNLAAAAIIVALCMLTGPLGGLRLQRLLAADIAAHAAHAAHSAHSGTRTVAVVGQP